MEKRYFRDKLTGVVRGLEVNKKNQHIMKKFPVAKVRQFNSDVGKFIEKEKWEEVKKVDFDNQKTNIQIKAAAADKHIKEVEAKALKEATLVAKS